MNLDRVEVGREGLQHVAKSGQQAGLGELPAWEAVLPNVLNANSWPARSMCCKLSGRQRSVLQLGDRAAGQSSAKLSRSGQTVDPGVQCHEAIGGRVDGDGSARRKVPGYPVGDPGFIDVGLAALLQGIQDYAHEP